jgi:hypothetical protein
MRKKIILLAIIFAVVIGSIQAGQHGNIQFQLNAPKDWRSETINFPLDFAPEIKYQGFEELRFAPGMFKPDSDTYFTYAFFWCLNGDEKITPAILESNLTIYFKGLCKAVGEARHLKIDASKISVKVNSDDLNAGAKSRYTKIYRATIDTFDPFNKGEAIKLNGEIAFLDYSSNNLTVLFFCISTKPFNNEIWKQLYQIRDSLAITAPLNN